jgi:hypothetical protein
MLAPKLGCGYGVWVRLNLGASAHVSEEVMVGRTCNYLLFLITTFGRADGTRGSSRKISS